MSYDPTNPTETFGFSNPVHRQDLWHEDWYHNFDILDDELIVTDSRVNRDQYQPREDRIYLAYDSGEIFRGTGSGWTPVLDSLAGDNITYENGQFHAPVVTEGGELVTAPDHDHSASGEGGDTILPSTVVIAQELGLPMVDDVATAPQAQGRVVYATGAGVSAEGIYKHDGTSYSRVDTGLLDGENFDGQGASSFTNLASLDAASAALTTAVVAEELGLPSYDDVTTAPQTAGRVVYATGAGASTEGIYKHNGTSYSRVLVEGEDFDGQGTSSLQNLESVGTDDLQIGSNAAHLAAAGYVVPIDNNTGVGSAIDASETTQALTDAYAELSGSGTILLPPERITEDTGNLGGDKRISIIGWGPSQSIIDYTHGSNPLFSPNSIRDVKWDGFAIEGPGDDSASGAVWDFQDTSSAYANLAWGHLLVRDFGAPMLHVPGGVSVFNTRMDCVRAQDIDAGNDEGVIAAPGNYTHSRINLLLVSPSKTYSGSDSDVIYKSGGRLSIGYLNVGGSPGVIINNQNGGFSLDMVNFEASNRDSGSVGFMLKRSEYCRVGYVLHQSGPVDWMYYLDDTHGNNVLGPVVDAGGTMNNNTVRNASAPNAYTWYFGESGDIDNPAGSSTGLIRSLADAGTGNG